MKKAFTILVILCTLGIVNLRAQETVATLEHQGTTTIFYGMGAFQDAYNASASGDTVYLSTGHFSSPTTINRGIKIYGAGCWLGSGLIPTTIDNLRIDEGSDGFALEGVQCGGILVYYYNGFISGLNFTRCWIANLTFDDGSYSLISVENCILTNCSFDGVSSGIIRNNLFHYSTLQSFISNASGLLIENNTFKRADPCPNCGHNSIFRSISGCTIKNNVIDDSQYTILLTGDNNTFSHNLCIGVDDSFFTTYFPTNTFTNNYSISSEDDLFISLVADAYNFNTNNDYHLKYPLLYLATDGHELGMYGGTTPFREQAIPCNPDITKDQVAPQTNSDGTLPVDIEAEAKKY